MNTLSLKVKIKDAAGNESTDIASTILSNLLLSSPVKGEISAKYFIWGLELVKSGTIQVDDIDKKHLVEFVQNVDGLSVLGRHRLLELFDQPDKPLKKAS